MERIRARPVHRQLWRGRCRECIGHAGAAQLLPLGIGKGAVGGRRHVHSAVIGTAVVAAVTALLVRVPAQLIAGTGAATLAP